MTETIESIGAAAGLSRRSVLKGLAAIGLLPGALAACTEEQISAILEAIANRPMRRNVHLLDDDDDIILAYQDAVTQMKALPSSDPRNWAQMADVHLNKCPHSNWLFLPWHRQYLYWFERIVRDLSGMDDWALPYWNWIDNPGLPNAFLSGVLDHSRQSTSASVAPATADAGMAPTTFINFGSGALSPTEAQRPAMSKTKSEFERTVHDTIHVQIGNGIDGMRSFRSPLDPIFWLHHNMIEYMWVEWNLGRGNLNPSDAHWTNFEFSGDFVDEMGTAVTGQQSSVSFSLLFPLIAYRFENSSVGTTMGTV